MKGKIKMEKEINQEEIYLEEEKELQEATKQEGINEDEERTLYENYLTKAGENND